MFGNNESYSKEEEKKCFLITMFISLNKKKLKIIFAMFWWILFRFVDNLLEARRFSGRHAVPRLNQKSFSKAIVEL